MPNTIHSTAIIDPNATLGDNISIGPYSVVGPEVTLKNHVTLKSHVVVEGNTTVGEHTTIFPFASIGHIPQDLKYNNEPSLLIIGTHNMIREHVTMNPGTQGDKMVTKVGNHCLFMVGAHIAHDCVVGDHVIMANNATLAGHVEVGDYAVIGGLAAIHQFVRIGHHAMIGGLSGIENDIIPYGQACGERADLVGLNLVGLKRKGLSRDIINSLRSAYRLMFSSEGTLSERLDDVTNRFNDNTMVMDIIAFMKSDSSRSICQPKNGAKKWDQ